MFKNFIIVSFLMLFSTAAFAANRSVYTPLTENKCRTKIDSMALGSMSGLCPGVGDYQLKYQFDDERMSVSVIAAATKKWDLQFWDYFGPFSSLGERAEWRLKDDKPVGLIIRYVVADRGEGRPRTSYLIVSRIDPENTCVVGVIKPGKNQNALARELADSALERRCMMPQA